MERIDENNTQNGSRPGLKRKTVVFGLLVLGFGFAWLLRNFDLLPYMAERIIFSWQMLVIAIGVINIANGQGRGFGAVLITVGAFFLVTDIYDLPITFTKAFWPSLLIIVGLFVLFGSKKVCRRRGRVNVAEGEDYIDDLAVFSGQERYITSKAFRGGKVVSIFGGSTIDLTEAVLAPGEVELDVTFVFGGSKFIVPSDWNVKVEVFSIFGGFEDKRRRGQVDYEKTLIIKGVAAFGGGELKHV